MPSADVSTSLDPATEMSTASPTAVETTTTPAAANPRQQKKQWARDSHFGPVVKQCLNRVLHTRPKDPLTALADELGRYSNTSLKRWLDFELIDFTLETVEGGTGNNGGELQGVEGGAAAASVTAGDGSSVQFGFRPVLSIRGFPVVSEELITCPFKPCPEVKAEEDATIQFPGYPASPPEGEEAIELIGIGLKKLTAVPLSDVEKVKVQHRFKQNCANVLAAIVESLTSQDCDAVLLLDQILSNIVDMEQERVNTCVEEAVAAVEELQRLARVGGSANASEDGGNSPHGSQHGSNSPPGSREGGLGDHGSAGENGPGNNEDEEEEGEKFDPSNAVADCHPCFTRTEMKQLQWSLLELIRKYSDEELKPMNDVFRRELCTSSNSLRDVAELELLTDSKAEVAESMLLSEEVEIADDAGGNNGGGGDHGETIPEPSSSAASPEKSKTAEDDKLFPPPQFAKPQPNPRKKQELYFALKEAERIKQENEANTLVRLAEECRLDYLKQNSSTSSTSTSSSVSDAAKRESMKLQLDHWKKQGYPLLSCSKLLVSSKDSDLLPENASLGIALSIWSCGAGPFAAECKYSGGGAGESSSSSSTATSGLPPLNAFEITMKHLAAIRSELATQLGAAPDTSSATSAAEPLSLPASATLADGVTMLEKTMRQLFPTLHTESEEKAGIRSRKRIEYTEPENMNRSEDDNQSGLETMPQDMIPKEKIFANFLKEAEEVDVVYDIERKPYGTKFFYEILVDCNMNKVNTTINDEVVDLVTFEPVENVAEPLPDEEYAAKVQEEAESRQKEAEEQGTELDPEEEQRIAAEQEEKRKTHLAKWERRCFVLQFPENMYFVEGKLQAKVGSVWQIPKVVVRKNPEVATWIEEYGARLSGSKPSTANSMQPPPEGEEQEPIPPKPDHFSETLGEYCNKLESLSNLKSQENKSESEQTATITLINPLPSSSIFCSKPLKMRFRGTKTKTKTVITDPSGAIGAAYGCYRHTMQEGPGFTISEMMMLSEKSWQPSLIELDSDALEKAASTSLGMVLALPRSARLWDLPVASLSTEGGAPAVDGTDEGVAGTKTSSSSKFGALMTQFFLQVAAVVDDGGAMGRGASSSSQSSSANRGAGGPARRDDITDPSMVVPDDELSYTEFADALTSLDVFVRSASTLLGYAVDKVEDPNKSENSENSRPGSKQSGTSKKSSSQKTSSDLEEQGGAISIKKRYISPEEQNFVRKRFCEPLLCPFLNAGGGGGEQSKKATITRSDFCYLGQFNGFASFQVMQMLLGVLIESFPDLTDKYQLVGDAVFSLAADEEEDEEDTGAVKVAPTKLPCIDFVDRMQNLPGKARRGKDAMEKVFVALHTDRTAIDPSSNQTGLSKLDLNQLPIFAQLQKFAQVGRLKDFLFAEFGDLLNVFKHLEQKLGDASELEYQLKLEQEVEILKSADMKKKRQLELEKKKEFEENGGKSVQEVLENRVLQLLPGKVPVAAFGKFLLEDRPAEFGGKFSEDQCKQILAILDPEKKGYLTSSTFTKLHDFHLVLFLDQLQLLRQFLKQKYESCAAAFNVIAKEQEEISRADFVGRFGTIFNCPDATAELPNLLFTLLDWSGIDVVTEADFIVLEHMNLSQVKLMVSDVKVSDQLEVLRQDLQRATGLEQDAKDWSLFWDRIVEEAGNLREEQAGM